MKLKNQSTGGAHPKQDIDPEIFDAARPNHGADEFFPDPENQGVQENLRLGGTPTQGRIKGKGQIQGQALTVPVPGVVTDSPPDDSACPAGQEKFNNVCVNKCAAGYTRNASGDCVLVVTPDPDCPAGQEKWNGQCVPVCAANELRDLQDGACKPDCNNTSTNIENAKPGDIVPPGYGPLIETRSSGGINFTATGVYIEHSQNYSIDSGEIKIVVAQAATPVHVRYYAWGRWDTWMDIADGQKSRNPIPVARIGQIEGQKFNWHDAWQDDYPLLVAVIWNETGAVTFKWQSQATRADPPSVTDALFLPHDWDYQPPSGAVLMEMWNGECVPKCSTSEHRNPSTGVCEQCPAGESWNGSECVGNDDGGGGGGGGGGVTCPAGQELYNGQCVAVCGPGKYRDASGQCVDKPAVSLTNAWGINSVWNWPTPDYEAFNPLKLNSLTEIKSNFANYMAPMGIFRFMNLQNMNGHDGGVSGSACHYGPSDMANRATGGFGNNGNHKGMHPQVCINIANAAGVIPWMHVNWTTAKNHDAAWLQDFANILQGAAAQKVIVEVGNEPWNVGGCDITGCYGGSAGAFIYHNRGASEYAIAHGQPAEWWEGNRCCPHQGAGLMAMRGSALMAKYVDSVLRPVLGAKLVMVVNIQSTVNATGALPQIFNAGWKPDAVAIATYYSAVEVLHAGWIGKLPELEARWQFARQKTNEFGVMLAAYEFGVEQNVGNTAGARAAVKSQVCADLITALGQKVVQYADFGCMYRVAGVDQFGYTDNMDVITPPAQAWKTIVENT